MENIVLIIPCLDPDEQLIKLVEDCTKKNFNKFVIVNDGSNEKCLPIFNKLEKDFGCKIFTHFKNLGKGRAIKMLLILF